MNYRKKSILNSYLYILPSFILIFVFSLLPLAMNIYYSFTRYNIIQDPTFIGLRNYARLFEDPYIAASLKNTIVFTFVTVPVQTILALVFAAIIAKYFRGKFGDALKSAFFVPVIASAVLVGTLFSIMLDPSGPVNIILSFLHLPTVNWLGGKVTSMISVCIATIWKNVGYFLVIYYAGIMDISRDLYEAAEVDGVTGIQSFIHITVPVLTPITYLVVTLGTIWSFQVFDMVYTMTGGGPGMSTVTLVLTIYNTAFKSYDMGYASTIALLLFVIVILIQFAQKKLLGESNE